MNMRRILTAALLALASAAIFVLGSVYYRIFPTNNNPLFLAVLTGIFLLAALLLRRSPERKAHARAAYALATASAASLLLSTGIFNLRFDLRTGMEMLAVDKFSQFLHVVPLILAMTLLARQKLGEIYIKVGDLKAGLRFGLLWFVLFAVAGWLLQIGPAGTEAGMLEETPWLLLFVFANAAMEELWFLGIFLRPFEELIGRKGAILVTALIFGASHISATYAFPGGGLVFGLVVFGLGAVGAYAMMKEDSLIGPVLFHAGYDLMIIASVLNTV